jgi:septal ring factor EnvC (AmiA/AmiB activator)
MRCLQFMGVLCLLLSSAVWAGTGQSAPKPGASATSALPAVQQRVARSQAEVQRLQRDLDRQETHSRQAGKRLQQQDQAIAELRKQLQALPAGPAASQH